MTTTHEELGFYALAGPAASSRDLIDQVRDGEAMGLGHAFISERFNLKEAGDAVGRGRRGHRHASGIATAATNHNTRHPMVTAAFATTMHRLTGGRFTLGIGRGIDPLFDGIGLPRITTAQIEDFVGLMRRLWQGEMILGHDGPSGTLPVPRTLDIDARSRTSRSASSPSGPNSLALGGEVLRPGRAPHVLHRRDDRALRADGAEGGGGGGPRPRRRSKVWSCFATIGDHLPEDLQVRKTVGRLATYLQGYGDLLVAGQRLGPGGARPLPRRPRRGRGPGRDRRHGDRRAARAHRHADPRRVDRPVGDGLARRSASQPCATSSTSAATASSSTAPPPPSWRRSSRSTGSARPSLRRSARQPPDEGSQRPLGTLQARSSGVLGPAWHDGGSDG